MGGEKFCAPSLVCCHTGSPPHGRGKVRLQEQDCRSGGITPAWAGKSHLTGGDRVLLRITPAWAGKSPFQTWSVPHSRDHPRMGGEKASFPITLVVGGGSPPHGRGKGNESAPLSVGYRITPAWAGKRLKRSHRSGIFISGPIPFHSVLHRPAGSGGSRAGRDGSPAGQPQNAGPA